MGLLEERYEGAQGVKIRRRIMFHDAYEILVLWVFLEQEFTSSAALLADSTPGSCGPVIRVELENLTDP